MRRRGILALYSGGGLKPVVALVWFIVFSQFSRVSAWCTYDDDYWYQNSQAISCTNLTYTSNNDMGSYGMQCTACTGSRACLVNSSTSKCEGSGNEWRTSGYCCHYWTCWCDCQNNRPGCTTGGGGGRWWRQHNPPKDRSKYESGKI
ncbi:MAG: hypothetical protein KatS3mg101_0509 [Patescibacteria group bacterium]|nr:MAG: hypothetical protein KatS3mg101_0509 [Patescibacteria group bacterium]